jgi:hypothetical protein
MFSELFLPVATFNERYPHRHFRLGRPQLPSSAMFIDPGRGRIQGQSRIATNPPIAGNRDLRSGMIRDTSQSRHHFAEALPIRRKRNCEFSQLTIRGTSANSSSYRRRSVTRFFPLLQTRFHSAFSDAHSLDHHPWIAPASSPGSGHTHSIMMSTQNDLSGLRLGNLILSIFIAPVKTLQNH